MAVAVIAPADRFQHPTEEKIFVNSIFFVLDKKISLSYANMHMVHDYTMLCYSSSMALRTFPIIMAIITALILIIIYLIIPERPVKKAQTTEKKLRMNKAMTPRAK